MGTNTGSSKAPVNKILILTCVVAAGLIIGIWIWKSVQLSHVRKQSVIEMQQLKNRAISQILKSEELYLKSLAKPFVWAVRSEMLKNNMSQVNLYAIEMVKEKNYQKIVVTDNSGVVLLSTNKKEEGKAFIYTGTVNYLKADTTTVENINDSLLIMSSPVMGFNYKLGTLIVIYSLQYPQLK